MTTFLQTLIRHWPPCKPLAPAGSGVALRAQALEGLCKVLECRELHLALPGAEPADGLRTEPMMMARETAEIGLPGEIYTPLAMD